MTEYPPPVGEISPEVKYKQDEDLVVLFGAIRRGLENENALDLKLTATDLKTMLPKVDDWLRTHGSGLGVDINDADIRFSKDKDGKPQGNLVLKLGGIYREATTTLVNSETPGEVEAQNITAGPFGTLSGFARESMGGTKFAGQLRKFFREGVRSGVEEENKGKYENLQIGFELTEDERFRIHFSRPLRGLEAAAPPPPEVLDQIDSSIDEFVSELGSPPETAKLEELQDIAEPPVADEEHETPVRAEEQISPADLRKDATYYKLVHTRKTDGNYDNYSLFYIVDNELKYEVVNPDDELKPIGSEYLTVSLGKGVNQQDIEVYISSKVKSAFYGREVEKGVEIVRKEGKIVAVGSGEYIPVTELGSPEVVSKTPDSQTDEPHKEDPNEPTADEIPEPPEQPKISEEEKLAQQLYEQKLSELSDKQTMYAESGSANLLGDYMDEERKVRKEGPQAFLEKARQGLAKTKKEVEEAPITLPLEEIISSKDPRLHSRASEEVVIDAEKNISVTFGIPTNENGALVEVPNKPHVFVADKLRVADPSHPINTLSFKDVNVMLAHGSRRTKDGKEYWAFLDGNSVVDTVRSFNEYARVKGLPPVEFLLVCNPDYLARTTGVKIDEFEGDTASSSTIAYAIGADVHITGFQEENGDINVSGDADVDFFNLNLLDLHKQIEIGPTEEIPTPTEPTLPPEPERPRVKPQDLRPGSNYYELMHYENPDTGEKGSYLFHYNPKEKSLTREQVDETGITNTNPNNVQTKTVNSKKLAEKEVDRILNEVQVREEFKNYKFERHIPIYEEEKTPEELATTLLTEVAQEERAKGLVREDVIGDFQKQTSHAKENLAEALSEFELAQKKVSEQILLRKSVSGPSLEAKLKNYEELLGIALDDYQSVYRNANSYLETKIKSFGVNEDDPSVEKFRELGIKAGETFRTALTEGKNPKDSVPFMQKYAEVIKERLDIFQQLEDKYMPKPKTPEIVDETIPENLAKGASTEAPAVKPRRSDEQLNTRGSARSRADRLHAIAQAIGLPQRPVRLSSETATPLPQIPTTEKSVTPEPRGDKGREERPQKTPVERFLEKNPLYRRVVKENGENGRTTYSFYNIALNRKEGEGGLIVFYFTLINEREYKTHTPIKIADPKQLDKKLEEHLKSSEDKFRWKGYEYVDLTSELEETLKKAKRVMGEKRRM